jgi:ADP-heptose:LPS heptosyltransferase
MQSISPTAPIALGTAKHALAAGLGLAAAGARLASGLRNAPPSPKHALLIEPYGLGDAISLLPLTHGLLHHGWKVTVCAREHWRDLFPAPVHWVTSRLPWTAYDDQQKYQAGSIFGTEMRSFLNELKQAASGAVGIDTRGDVRSLTLLWLARCDRVLSLDRYLGYDLANRPWSAELVNYSPALRRWQSNLRFLSAICPEADPGAFPLDLRSRWTGLGDSPLPQTIGLIPLAPWLGKTWPTEAWRTLIARLRASGWKPCGLAGPGQPEATASALGLGPEDVFCCDSIESWARQLSRLSAVVSVDTGPMHLADALRVPLVALYGAGTLPLWAPSSPRSVALHRQQDTDYTPVHPTGDGIARGQELMKRHTPDAVLAALQTVANIKTS